MGACEPIDIHPHEQILVSQLHGPIGCGDGGFAAGFRGGVPVSELSDPRPLLRLIPDRRSDRSFIGQSGPQHRQDAPKIGSMQGTDVAECPLVMGDPSSPIRQWNRRPSPGHHEHQADFNRVGRKFFEDDEDIVVQMEARLVQGLRLTPDLPIDENAGKARTVPRVLGAKLDELAKAAPPRSRMDDR